MGAVTLCPQDNDFRHDRPSQFPASLLQRFPNLPKDVPGRARIGVKCIGPRVAREGVPEIPLAVGATGEPMDSLCGLHDAELSDAVAFPIILDESRDPKIDRDKPPCWDLRCPETSECDPSAILS